MFASASSESPEPLLPVARIQRFCLTDGPGIRSSVLLQGCPWSCRWCHDPSLQAPPGDATRTLSAPDLLAELERDSRYWDSSGGGVTLSGGEPLLQSAGCAAFLELARELRWHRCLATAGAGPLAACQALAPLVDLWLYDFKTAVPEQHRAYTGGDLAQALENLRWLLARGLEVWLRIPLLDNLNRDAESLNQLTRLIGELPGEPLVLVQASSARGSRRRSGQASRKEVEAAAAQLASTGRRVEVR